MENKNIFFWIIFLFLILFWAGYNLLVPFFPLEAKKIKLTNTLIGLILGFYSLGSYFSAIFLGKYLSLFNKDKLIFYSFTINSISNIAFGLLDLIHIKNVFIIVAIVSRIIQGIAVGTVTTVVMSMMRGLFGNEFEGKIAMLEMSGGIGIALGPVISAGLISFLKYLWMFVVYGILLFFGGVFYIIIIKKIQTNEQKEIQEEEVKSVKPIKYKDLLKKRFIWITYIFFSFILTAISVDYPILSINLKKRFKLTESQIGLLFFPSAMSYFITSSLFYVFNLKFNNKLKFFIGYIFLMIGLYLMLPHKNLFKGDFLWLVVVGFVCIGFGASFIIVSGVPEFTILILNLKIEDVTSEAVDDMASGIFVSLDGISEFLGPLLGGILFDNFGFAIGQYIYMVFLTLIYIIYIIFANGYEAFTKPLEVFDFESSEEKNKYIEQIDEQNEIKI